MRHGDAEATRLKLAEKTSLILPCVYSRAGGYWHASQAGSARRAGLWEANTLYSRHHTQFTVLAGIRGLRWGDA
jgi:hypothetical protein